MTDLVARLRIDASTKPASAEVIEFNRNLGNTEASGKRARSGLEAAGDGARNLESRLKGASSGAALLAGALGYVGVRELTRDLVDSAQASKGFETSLGAVAGGAVGAKSALGFVRSEAIDLGIDVRTAAQSFVSLAGATNGTSLAGQKTRDIWLGVTEAGLAMGRSNEEVKRGLEAVSQIASKGVVSMEEIRQQLAEAIPGATNIAARAMGMTTAEFNKLVATGKLASSDFLPKFAAQLRTEFGPAIDKYLNSDIGRARVEIGKLKTDLFDLSAIGGEAFLGGVIDGLSGLHRELTDQETQEAARQLGRELGTLAGEGAKGVGLLVDNADKLSTVLGVVVGLRAGAWLAGVAAEAVASAEGVGLLAAATTALGGPLAIVAALAGGVVLGGLAAYGSGAAKAAADAAGLDDAVGKLQADMADSGVAGLAAAQGVDGFGKNSAAAQQLVESLTGKVGKLADELYRVAAANKAAAITSTMADIAKAQSELDKVKSNANREIFLFGALTGGFGADVPDVSKTTQAAAIAKGEAAIEAAKKRVADLINTPLTDKRWNPPQPKDTPAPASSTKSKADRAGNLAKDLAADVVALTAYRVALAAGGQALDEWRIKDAGRQAVEKAGLTHKAALTAAETTLAGKIRSTAEETERLRLANERVEKAIGLKKSADDDTAALKRRSEAAMKGEQALEELQVKEAGLAAMRQIGIETLDQLSGADRASAEAAIAAAEAKERQAIATQKADQVGSTLRDLDRRIAAEKSRTAAVQGSTRALADYSRQEFVRQQIEAAGKNLLPEQIALLKAKAEALYEVIQANDQVDRATQKAEELRQLSLTREERELDNRAREIAIDLQTKNLALTDEEAKKLAEILALQEKGNEDRAKAISQLGDAVRDEFIRSGKLGFKDVADYAEQELRRAIYDTFLKEPITAVIHAVVDVAGGLKGAIGGLGGGTLASLLGAGGTGMAIGQSLGLGTGNQAADLGLSLGGAALGTAFAGSGLAASLGTTVANGVIGALGSSSVSYALAGGLSGILSSAAVLGPIAAIAALGIGTLFKQKPSNNGALATLTDDSFSLSGNKRTSETSQMATAASQAILQGEQMLKSAGIKLNATVKTIDIGTRDATDIVLSDGRALTSAVGDSAAAAETALKAVLQGATYTDETQKQLVESMVAAGKGFDAIAAALGQLSAAQLLPQTIADAIQKLTDPKAYAVGQLGKDQATRRQQIADAASAGYLTAEQLAAVNVQLAKLEGLELDDVMKQFAGSVDTATQRLKDTGDLKADINEGFLKILDPVQYQLVRGAREISDAIDEMKARAEALIATGDVGPEVLDQLDALKQLQLAQLTDELNQTNNAFVQARKSLLSWIDQLNGSANSELSPAAQAQQTYADYQRILGQARGGDADALSQITGYADRAIEANRNAQDSAQARLAFVNQIKSDILGLANAGSTFGQTDQVATQIKLLQVPLSKLLVTGEQTVAANDNIVSAITPSLAVSVANLPSLKAAYGEAMTVQTDRIVQSLAAIEAAVNALHSTQATSTADQLAAIGDLSAATGLFSGVINDVFTQLQQDQRINGAYLRSLVSAA